MAIDGPSPLESSGSSGVQTLNDRVIEESTFRRRWSKMTYIEPHREHSGVRFVRCSRFQGSRVAHFEGTNGGTVGNMSKYEYRGIIQKSVASAMGKAIVIYS